jgi:hypothetical protein
VVLVVAALLALPPLAEVVRAGGIAIAGVQGTFGAEPWKLLLPALAASGLLFRRVPPVWVRLQLGGALGLVAVVAILLRGAGRGLDLDQWYPLKACWLLTLFLAPWLAVSAVRAMAAVVRPAWRMSARVGNGGFVLRSTVIALAAAVALVAWLPWQLGPAPDVVGAWQPYRATPPGADGIRRPLYAGGALDVATRFGTAFAPAVAVPYRIEENLFYDPFSSLIVSKLFAFQNGTPDIAGSTDVCDAIRRVAGDRPAVVITRAAPTAVRRNMASSGCPGRASVVHLTGTY